MAPLVLIVGATGHTGYSIVKGLKASGNFRVAALIRSSSLSKPTTEQLRADGVEIRVGDLTDDVETLKKALSGVDIVISAVIAWMVDQQKDLIRAAKEVGVQRFIPCDFATPGAKGVRDLHDKKLAIREFIKDLGVPYTFIDVGWWFQCVLPIPLRSKAPESIKENTWKVLGDGDSKILATHVDSIGTFVARILADPRTLNQAVIIWEEEVRQGDAFELGARVSGEGDALRARRVSVGPDAFLKAVEEGRKQAEKDPNDISAHVKISWNEYLQSVVVLRENTLENAKRLGYLDARELYPDIVPAKLEEYAKEYYAMEEPARAYGIPGI